MLYALDALMNPKKCAKLNDPSICNLEQFTTEDYIKALSLITYNGITGKIKFNQTQPNRQGTLV